MLPAAATRGGAEALPAPGQGLPAPHRTPLRARGGGWGRCPLGPVPRALLPSPPLPRSHKAAAAAPAPLPPSLSRSFPLCPPLTRAPPPGPSPGSGPAARAQRRPRPRSRPAAARSAPAAAMSAAPRGPSAPGRGPRRRTEAAGRGRAQPARFPPPVPSPHRTASGAGSSPGAGGASVCEAPDKPSCSLPGHLPALLSSFSAIFAFRAPSHPFGFPVPSTNCPVTFVTSLPLGSLFMWESNTRPKEKGKEFPPYPTRPPPGSQT